MERFSKTKNPRIKDLPFALQVSYQFICYSKTEIAADFIIDGNRFPLLPRNDLRIIALPETVTRYGREAFSVKLRARF